MRDASSVARSITNGLTRYGHFHGGDNMSAQDLRFQRDLLMRILLNAGFSTETESFKAHLNKAIADIWTEGADCNRIFSEEIDRAMGAILEHGMSHLIKSRTK